ncbi:unnamed protein product [Vitrella brassicaformis CCMP3155]|uniref:Conserved oligomeric Golgi complex subunit 5 n=1 Tax=Vitrella brassicaformis (strain CCMP3155) TaxID=1169540 RepID=A0A0G4EH42_VITBC|nr:unnamed protein product [Vitrella brassicaformis CCMP3155]|eukprot:CEL94689.1 unnamed protein product [Vitrella brassicaformis CCMP3155]
MSGNSRGNSPVGHRLSQSSPLNQNNQASGQIKAVLRERIDPELSALFEETEDVVPYVRAAAERGPDHVLRAAQLLEKAVNRIDSELHSEVVACHEHLLQNVSSIDDLDRELGAVRQSVDTIKDTLMRVEKETLDPFKVMKQQVETLERLYAASDLIRSVLRFNLSVKKLRAQMDPHTPDIAKAAQTLFEMEGLLNAGRGAGGLPEGGVPNASLLSTLSAEAQWVRDLSKEIRDQARTRLRTGMRNQSKLDLNVACQVFYNLNCLGEQLEGALAEQVAEVDDNFNVKPILNASVSGQLTAFWGQLTHFTTALHTAVKRMVVLDQVVWASADGSEGHLHYRFDEVLEDRGLAPSLTEHFWRRLMQNLSNKMVQLVGASSTSLLDARQRSLRMSLASEYPKLRTILLEVLQQLQPTSRVGGAVRQMVMSGVTVGAGRRSSAIGLPERQHLLGVFDGLRQEHMKGQMDSSQ